jgi:tetratricopeptide (TPR) repeat protein
MAKRELWNEALFRFHEAEKLDPANPHIQNNLGVAYEAVGEFDKALTHYQQALKGDPGSKEMKANYARFVEFYQSFKGKQGGPGVTAQSQGVKPSQGPLDPPTGEPLPAQRPPTIVEPPSTPEDTPPPPADNRPSR